MIDDFEVGSPRNDRVLWLGGAGGDMFVRRGYAAERRAAFVETLARYCESFESEVTHYLPFDARRLRQGDGRASIEYFRARLDDVGTDRPFYASVVGIPADSALDEPSHCQFGGWMGEDDEPNTQSSLSFGWPSARLAERPDEFVAFYIDACERMDALHGCAGLTLLHEEGNAPYAAHFDQAFPTLRRHPGLDYVDTAHFHFVSEPDNEVTDRPLRAVNWLTALGTPLVDRLGGMEALREAVSGDAEALGLDPAHYVWHEHAGGIVVQAGVLPQAGDGNAGDLVPLYGPVARASRPVRFEDYVDQGLFHVPEPLDEVEETLRWVRRFD